MSIRAVCPGCGVAYTVPESALGKKTRCRKCDQRFVVGAAPPAADDFAGLDTSAPTAARGRRRAPDRLRLYLAAGGGLLGLVAVGVAVWSLHGRGQPGAGAPWASGLTDADFAKLKLGMSLDEVQVVLGRGSELSGPEVPLELQDRLDNPQVKGQIDLVEPRQWYRWASAGRTVYVGLSETTAGDRVTVLALDRPGGLKLECGNIFPRRQGDSSALAAGNQPPAGQGIPSGQRPGDKRPAPTPGEADRRPAPQGAHAGQSPEAQEGHDRP
jgi:hypothetical protein